jgi:NADPH:quinone reductase-like Zn-dependent oxidoreductase
MKAAVHTRYGPPDVVRIVDVERPTAAANEVLVKVHATTVNRTDCGFRAAHPWIVRFFSGLTKPKATILGCEFGGEIEAVGRDVTSFEIGERVFGFSEDRFGAHAEYLTMPQDGPMATIPPDLSFEEIAPSTEGSHYALSAVTRARIRGGQRVLVNGGTGAIGSAAVQLLKELGAVVTAVADTAHLELMRGLGADPRDRQDGRGLHAGRSDVRRRARRGRQELVRTVQAAAGTARDLPLGGPRSALPEPVAGARHATAW